MYVRFYSGVVALLAATALTSPSVAFAQEQQSAEVEAAQPADDLVQDTIVIRGAFIPDEKRETSEISSLLSAEDFAVQGDSDVAGALRRVTGVSVADSKFVYVRGLNERYSSSTLNGSPLPSPEPLRRVAPLDLFPTSVLESLVVQKTYSPEYSAEFGGGNVDIRTKSVPDAPFFNIGLSTSGNTETSFQDGLMYDGSDSDYLGYDDGTRDLPDSVGALLGDGEFNLANQTNDQLVGYSSEIIDNSSLLVMQEGYVGPDIGMNFSGGHRFDFSNAISMGILGAASYSNGWTTKEGKSGVSFLASADTLNDSGVGDRRSTENNIEISSLASVGFDLFDNHEASFLGFLTRSTDKESQITERVDNDSGNFEHQGSLTWVERQLWTTQAQGKSVFPFLADLEMTWRASYSEAERDAPYDVAYMYQRQENETDDALQLAASGGDTRFRFSKIMDDTTDLGFDFLLPLYFGDLEFNIKAGYAYVEKDRESQSTDFTFQSTFPTDLRGLRIDYALNERVNGDDVPLFVSSSTESPDYSVATLEVDAGYFGIDAQVTNFLRVALGGRYEDSIQVVETRPFQSGPGNISTPIEETRFLPAATVTWNFADDLQLRVGYSETVTRPQFREMSPTFFENQETDVGYFGNRYLLDAELKNYDGRLEYYFSRDQFITVGAFYKELENVIEEVLTSDENLTTTFVNVPKAELYGVELEYEQLLPVSDWLEWSWLASKDISLKANYTWSQSELSYEEGHEFTFTSRTPEAAAITDQARFYIDSGRAMSGQSDHLLNFQIGYTDLEAESEANLLFNFASERIRFGANNVGARRPEVIEQPPMSVDFVYNRDFDLLGGDYSFGFKLKNILGEEYDWYQQAGDQVAIVNNYELGRTISFSLKRSF
ncbi:TonB-dependent receptor domain-containing protein [Hirschia litorea]|uniref:TonB-dependent receptor domain-containing protein n=1 Tax=Hirschia litorea TaxID=1199156 RepID=A0ABW2IH56_9PROT